MSDITKKGKVKRLGIDLGTNSLGWALLEIDKDIENKKIKTIEADDTYATIIDAGVRIFSDGRRADNNTSLAVERRKARGARRTISRRKQRWNKLVKELNNTKGYTLGEDDKNLDPYKLRSEALSRKLEPNELARAIFHLGKRRGYQDVGELFAEEGASESKEDKEEKNNLGLAHNNLTNKIQYTLGHSQYVGIIPKRFNTVLKDVNTIITNEETNKKEKLINNNIVRPYRDDYKNEFDAIRAKQEPYHPNLNWDKIKNEIIFHQNHLKAGDRSICSCCMDKDKIRTYMASPSYERYRLISDLHNLRVKYNSYDKNYEELTIEQRHSLYDLISQDKRDVISFIELTKLPILMNGDKKPIFNLASAKSSDGGLKTLAHNNQLAKILGDNYQAICQAKKEDLLVETMLSSKDPNIYATAMQKNDFENHIGALKNFKPKNKDVGGICVQCARKMTEYMLDGYKPHEAREFISKYVDEYELDELPYYGKILNAYTQKSLSGSEDEKAYGRIGNPTVHVALNQLRKVMNAIIKEYGKPDEIRIELGREIKDASNKNKYIKERDENTKERKKDSEDLLNDSKNAITPTLANIEKYRLWKKQNHECLYCGQKFAISQWSDMDKDHVLPRSKTGFNNSFNIVLACNVCNKEKGARDPQEAWGHNTEKYKLILGRVKTYYKDVKDKIKLFDEGATQEYLDNRAFGENQKPDNNYIAKISTLYLERLYNKPREEGSQTIVKATKGGITDKIRRAWRFNEILSNPVEEYGTIHYPKNREDHRHHTVDAIAIALMSNSIIHSYNNQKNKADRLPCPIDYSEVVKKIAEVIPSIKADHGINNALFEDTAYGLYEKKAKDIGKKDFSCKDKFADKELQSKFDQLWQEYFITLCLADNDISSIYNQTGLSIKNLDNCRKYRHRLYRKKEEAFNKAKDDIFGDELSKKVFKQIYHTRGQNSKEIKEKGVEKTTQNAIEVKRKKGTKESFKAYKPDGYICVEIWQVPPKRKGNENLGKEIDTTNWNYEGRFISPAMAMERMAEEIKAKQKLDKYKNKSYQELENIVAKTIRYSNTTRYNDKLKDKPHPQAKFIIQLFKKDIVRGTLSQKMIEAIRKDNPNIKSEELEKHVYMRVAIFKSDGDIIYQSVYSSNNTMDWINNTKKSKTTNGHIFWNNLKNKDGFKKAINQLFKDFEGLEKVSLTSLGKVKNKPI